ncbi:hypothetical protein O5D80_004244 [Batrachochytrium dendrobatidis]|nr:hypothetical protein O5D80_004244 [Batrachochytrium dendrobatidis]
MGLWCARLFFFSPKLARVVGTTELFFCQASIKIVLSAEAWIRPKVSHNGIILYPFSLVSDYPS